MTPIIAWLLKSILCSGILYGYYLLFLKDKIFNKYNRFYLLAAVVLSLILPFVHFSVQPEHIASTTGFQMLTTVIATGGENFDEVMNAVPTSFISLQLIGYIFYAIPALLLLIGLSVSLVKIYQLYRKNQVTKIEDVTMVTTDDAPGTPFSFFNFLFWNKNINLHSDTGKKILSHELVHIKQKHSVDKVALQIAQCIFWINPFIWLIKRELSIIHEFLADEEAVAPGDTAAFAEMMLQSAYAGSNFSITNHLTYSSIKRRIKMINKNKNPKMNYLSRIIAIPVIAGLVFVSSAYISKVKEENKIEATESGSVNTDANQTPTNKTNTTIVGSINTKPSPVKLNSEEPIVVLLDAGHGGDDAGSMNLKTKQKEKDITLAIVKKIVELNKDENIKFILTRTKDETIAVKDRTINHKEDIDLFVSIHIDADGSKEQSERSGLNIWVPKLTNKSAEASRSFAAAMTGAFADSYELPVSNTARERSVGIWVLQAFDVPSILLEAGYINNPKDIAFLTSEKGLTSIANNILNGIKSFANGNSLAISSNHLSSFTFTGKVGEEVVVTGIKKEGSVKIVGGEEVVVNGYPNKKEDVKFEISGDVLQSDSYDNFKMTGISKFSNTGKLPSEDIYLDGVKIDASTLNRLNADDIASISILKDAAAIKLYGETAKEGVILITSKKNDGAVYVVDGVVTDKTAFGKIMPNDIQSINVIKDAKAIKLYGENGKKGVIEVTTKKEKPSKYQ